MKRIRPLTIRPSLLAIVTALVALGTPLRASALEILRQVPTFSTRLVFTTDALTVVFSNSLDPATVDTSTFFITGEGEAGPVPGTISIESMDLPGDTVVFTPEETWTWGKRYWVNIDAEVADIGGSPFDGTFPGGPLFVANIPNDFEIPVFDPSNPFGMMEDATVLMGFNPLDPEADSAPYEIPGMNVTGAWKYTLGSPEVIVGIVDDGFIDYGNPDFRTALFLNEAELPLPLAGEEACADHDCNGDGRFNVDDYAADARVLAVAGGDAIDVGHLIEVFSDGVDDDGNGLADDISGWDFFRGTNVVLGVSEFPEGVHGRGELRLIVDPGDDGRGSVPGICPNCRAIFIRTSQQIMYDFGLVAAGVRYAMEMGADLINFAGVPYGFSVEAHQAFVDAYEQGALTVAPSGDEMGMHHWWPAAGEDVISVKTIFPMVPVELWEGGANMGLFGFTETFCTNFGTHVHASIPAVTGCTSDSTANTTGLLALIVSYARELGYELTAGEIMQIFIGSCDDIADHCFSVPDLFGVCQEGFDLHFGYGRPDAERALLMLGDPDRGIPARIPPEVRITEPVWWETIDPTRTPEFVVRGHIASRVNPYSYEVQIARGPEPLDDEFMTICSGTAEEPMDGPLCTVVVGNVLDPEETSGVPYSQFDFEVTLRVRAYYETGAETVRGEARKSISIHSDDDPETGLVEGFPIDVQASGWSSPVLYDMDGAADGRLEIVLTTSDGLVHVLVFDGESGLWGEMDGFPVDVSGGDPYVSASIQGSPAVGDIFGDGLPCIAAATTRGEAYVIHAEGNLHADGSPFLTGFPVSADEPPNDSPLAYGHGNSFMASPILADLDGDGRLEIIAGSVDQKIYAWRPEDLDDDGDADRLPGWPVLCRSDLGLVPAAAVCDSDMPAQIITTPAIGVIDPWSEDPEIRDYPSVIVSTTETCGETPASTTRVYAIFHDGMEHPGGPFLPGWPAMPMIPLGDSIPIPMAVGSTMSPVVAVEECVTRIGVGSAAFFPQIIYYKGDEVGIRTTMPGLNITSMANGAMASLDGSGDLSLIVPMISALNVDDWGIHLLSFRIVVNAMDEPYQVISKHQIEDMPMWMSPVVADLDNDGTSEIITGGGGYLVHAFNQACGEAPGWPKYTQKWVTAAPAVGDIDADGLLEVVVPTQEGILYAWESAGIACRDGRPGSDWPRFQHDERNSGFYGADTVPPGRIVDLEARRGSGDRVKIVFTAPGDDWTCGPAATYDVRYSLERADLGDARVFAEAERIDGLPAPGEAGTTESIVFEAPGASAVAVRAVDESGNLSRISNVAVVDTADGEGAGGTCGCSQLPGSNGAGSVNVAMLLICLGFIAVWRRASKR